jgi:hypothetical protein
LNDFAERIYIPDTMSIKIKSVIPSNVAREGMFPIMRLLQITLFPTNIPKDTVIRIVGKVGGWVITICAKA